MVPERLLRRPRRTMEKRHGEGEWDERLPDGRTVYEALSDMGVPGLMRRPSAVQQEAGRVLAELRRPGVVAEHPAPASPVLTRPAPAGPYVDPATNPPAPPAVSLERPAPVAVRPRRALPSPEELTRSAPYESPAVAVEGRVRNAPPPGELEANDARMAAALERAGPASVPESQGYGYRPRVVDRLGYEEGARRMNRNSRWASGGLAALRLFGDHLARGGSPLGGLGAAAYGFAHGAIDPTFDEELDRRGDVARLTREEAARDAREKRRLDLEGDRAGVRLRTAQAEHWEARPELDAEKNRAAAERARELAFGRGQQRVMRMLNMRLKNPAPFNPDDPNDARLARAAEEYDVVFNPEMFGDHSSPKMVDAYDPADPTGTKKIPWVWDKAAKVLRPAPAEGGAPVVTEIEEARDPQGVKASTRQRLAQGERRLDQGDARLRLSAAQLHNSIVGRLSADAARRFNIETKGAFESLRRVQGERAKLERENASGKYRAGHYEAEKKRLEGLESELRGRIDTAESKFAGSASSAPPAPLTRPPAGRYAGLSFSRRQFPELQRKFGFKTPKELEDHITAGGGEIEP